jgi:DNA-binding NtrC family response regulator
MSESQSTATDQLHTASKDQLRILVVDDESVVRQSLFHWFTEDGYAVEAAADAAEALRLLQIGKFDLALVDIKMPGMDGMELQKRLREIDPDLIVIIITAYASVETAVQALKQGAFDYVTKPVDPDHLEHMVQNALKQRRLALEKARLEGEVARLASVGDFIGESEGARKVMDLIETVAPTDTTVMIRGESGTGKELIARALHMRSKRRFFPFIPINCGGLTDSLLESELFGHEKGAFTGAHFRRKGKLELADGGSIFLDEVGNITQKTQMDLLRVLETKQFTRVGGTRTVDVDFRTICATNRDLEKAVAGGDFREDLFYRLNVFVINVSPLRERRLDIPLLARYFLEKYGRAMSKPIQDIEPEAMARLESYRWPGNVRELENAIERAVVVGSPPVIRAVDLPEWAAPRDGADDWSMDAIEKRHVAAVLERTGGNVTRAADILGINRVTLYNKIKKYNLR